MKAFRSVRKAVTSPTVTNWNLLAIEALLPRTKLWERLGERSHTSPSPSSRSGSSSYSSSSFTQIKHRTKRRGPARFNPHYPSSHPAFVPPASRRKPTPQKNGSQPRPPVGLGRQMLTYVTVASTPTADTAGSSLLLHFENRRYLIGHVSEGTQRLMIERKLAMGKIEEIMLTGPVSFQTCGGLMGMILTLAGIVTGSKAQLAELSKAGKAKGNKRKQPRVAAVMSSLKLRSGDNLDYFLALGRKFILRKGMPVETREILTDPRLEDPKNTEADWEDENIKVWHVPVHHTQMGRKRRKTSRGAGSVASGSDEGGSPKRSFRPQDGMTDSDRELLKSVVSHMFESEWRMDALFETPLHEVKLPAKIFVRNKNGRLEKYEGPLPGTADNVPNIPVLVRRPWPGSQVHSLPFTSPSETSMCYIIKTQPRRGKFNREAAEKLRLEKKQYGLLTAGQSVTTAAGVTVTPDMVMEKPIPGTGFAAIDIPSAEYVESLLSRPEWAEEGIMGGITAFFWILGPGMVQDEKILDFMRKHSDSGVVHYVSSKDISPNKISFGGAAGMTVQHNMIDPDRFPLLAYDDKNPVESAGKGAATADSKDRPYVEVQFGAKLQLAPTVTFQDEEENPFDIRMAAKNMDPKILAMAEAARKKISSPEFRAWCKAADADLPCGDVEVISLGTGSSLPSKYRNVSATLVRVPGSGSYLFDCGENTMGQIRRQFGPRGAEEVLRDLRCVYLSHLHADHHMGTVTVLRAWDAATSGSNRRLAVVGTSSTISYFEEYPSVETLGGRLDMITIRLPPKGPAGVDVDKVCPPYVVSDNNSAIKGDLARIDCCLVDHCHGAIATVFTWTAKDGREPLKVAYSGDCRPSEPFAKLAQDATLLIHESTFDDEMVGDALAKKHSTMSEAIEVGRKMRARRLLLTHFSQRYPKIPVFDGNGKGGDSESSDHNMPVLIAFDNMSVKLRDFREAAEFLPALRKLYEESADGDVEDEETQLLKQAATAEDDAATADVPVVAAASGAA